MIESFRNIFAIPDLRKRLMFTFGLLAVYRIGCNIPTPGVDPQALVEFMAAMQGTFLGFVNTFTGGSLERVAVFALGIMPYITASIILQLLTVVWPYLEKLSKEGELGRRTHRRWQRTGRSEKAGKSMKWEGGCSRSGFGPPPGKEGKRKPSPILQVRCLK